MTCVFIHSSAKANDQLQRSALQQRELAAAEVSQLRLVSLTISNNQNTNIYLTCVFIRSSAKANDQLQRTVSQHREQAAADLNQLRLVSVTISNNQNTNIYLTCVFIHSSAKGNDQLQQTVSQQREQAAAELGQLRHVRVFSEKKLKPPAIRSTNSGSTGKRAARAHGSTTAGASSIDRC